MRIGNGRRLTDLQYPEGEHEDGANKFKDELQGKAQDSKGQQDQPDDRQYKQQHQRKRPAQHEQDTP